MAAAADAIGKHGVEFDRVPEDVLNEASVAAAREATGQIQSVLRAASGRFLSDAEGLTHAARTDPSGVNGAAIGSSRASEREEPSTGVKKGCGVGWVGAGVRTAARVIRGVFQWRSERAAVSVGGEAPDQQNTQTSQADARPGSESGRAVSGDTAKVEDNAEVPSSENRPHKPAVRAELIDFVQAYYSRRIFVVDSAWYWIQLIQSAVLRHLAFAAMCRVRAEELEPTFQGTSRRTILSMIHSERQRNAGITKAERAYE
jgi:hypothetical protein